MFCLGCVLSVVVVCKAEGFNQEQIVESFLQSLDEKCGVIDNSAASNLARGSKNPSVYVMDALKAITSDDYERLTVYFRDKVVPYIKENDRNVVRDALIMLVQDEPEIHEDTVVEVISKVKKSNLSEYEGDLATFLAGIFLYVLKNTTNIKGGKAKKFTQKYVEKARNSEKPLRKTPAPVRKEAEPEPDRDIREEKTREVLLREENIERDAIAFCMKYEEKKALIPLCQVAFVTNPTKKHESEMYNGFSLCTASTQRRILEMSEIEILDISGMDWWYQYLVMFEKDYEKYQLGDMRYLYAFAQYFPDLIHYGDASIGRFLQNVIPLKVVEPYMEAFPNYKHDIIGFLDEYLYYSGSEEYKGKLEPPMDDLWRGLQLGDADACDEFMLASVLALFIIGACQSIPSQDGPDREFHASSAPDVGDLETAEDLFYDTLLTLYEHYAKA